ncbi:hypothetical protein QUB70_05450 [Microcoleus sp. A003_D6]|uniref:hypothetical protein n=1 Tax=Microcoleus sp. A003_D6 TaxID=3055266 RepID=UPI002FD2AC90
MTREVTDSEGIVWSCVEAYSGLSDKPENREKAQVKGSDDAYWVVCTPAGGAKSVWLQQRRRLGKFLFRRGIAQFDRNTVAGSSIMPRPLL